MFVEMGTSREIAAAVIALDDGEFGKTKKKKRSQWCRNWLHERKKTWSHVNLLHGLRDASESGL
jgi:hypothetical protein